MAPIMLSVVIVLAFTFGIDYASHGFVRAYVRSVAATFIGSIPGSDSIVGFFASRNALRRENQVLRDEIVKRAEQSEYIDSILRENDMLRDMARVAEEGDGITVPVVSSVSSSPYGTFVVGAGSNNGIREGSMVLTAGGFVLGSVTSVGRDTSVVTALFGPGQSFDLAVGSVAFSAEGYGGGNARARVPRDAPIVVGDTAVVPAFRARPAGVVASVESASTSAESTLHLHLPVNTTSLLFVYVVSRI